MPSRFIAWWKPRLVITVVTTVSRRSLPCDFRCLARIAMMKSPSTSSPDGVDGEHAVAVAVERQAEVEAVRGHDLLQGGDVGAAAAGVDVGAVRTVEQHRDLAPHLPNASGAARCMAPLAQSTAIFMPPRSSGMRSSSERT